ncbi:hypothetical protein CcaverHIS002_0306180 [Cutaneotrichosporon cavernicola]|uniref:Uncharacterized protein n=1 Tax=Cutaneotrichosporon cavernicola TaxID=279322 RepID=A0AA48KZI2_9TREE|nr:uncharacterized protein CcaverHIS019_0306140 [Cutaneotrichosporon cavernicola]BEI82750.1 hypothetical protein CcaverHIS002_0306180 [Cutaneotrichosporon cavernicola]BEI90544.1 hypothetical protein CcaverHIS019_0306140 [Cutaneotrichosporon cavernicola]BEI98318.1 hypothetical protein CcaverHIS631_0306170 [Cutaneotrichosporon cavernicola]BEJ06094.1 hypothetical protein CcaverHIS641_0306160 [Cutaneotrichosporon cavernicola]
MALLDGIGYKVLNIVVFALTFGSNLYNVIGPHHSYSGLHDTYVTPSAYAFWIWTLIHMLLFCMIIYQFTDRGKAIIVDRIQYRFAVLGLLNTAFIWLTLRGFYITAFIVMLLVAGSVSQIYFIINADTEECTLPTELFIHLPFSFYHGWTVVLTVLALFQAFGVDADTHKAGVWTKIFVFLSFLFLESTAAGYAFATASGDPAGAAVISWALFSIYLHQTVPFIKWSAFAFFILSLFAVIKAVYSSFRAGRSILHDEERAPLIAGAAD